MVLFQKRIFRALKSMSRDERHGIRFNPQRIVGFISDGCGGVDWRAARADWPSRTCNASLRGASRQREAAAAARAAPCFRRRRRRLRVAPAATKRSVRGCFGRRVIKHSDMLTGTRRLLAPLSWVIKALRCPAQRYFF